MTNGSFSAGTMANLKAVLKSVNPVVDKILVEEGSEAEAEFMDDLMEIYTTVVLKGKNDPSFR